MFTRGRLRRAVAALFIATALVASSFASTVGAIANIHIGGGDTVETYVTGATPAKVSPDKVAGFYVWLHNADAANLSSFFLNAAVTDATPVGAYWTHDLVNGPWNACDTSPALRCAFGAFNSNTNIYVVAAFTVPASSTKNCLPTDSTAGIAPDTSRDHVCVDFQFGADSGYVVGPGKNKSRGDAYHWYDVVYTDTGSDSAAQFPFCDLSAQPVDCDEALLTLNDSKTNFGKNNPQWTSVLAPSGAFNSFHGSSGIAVADGVSSPCTGDPDDPEECAITFLGQFSQVDVNDAQDFSPDYVRIDIGVYGVGVNKISAVYHFYFVDGALTVETLGTCPTSAGPGTMSCFWATSLGGNASQVTIWTHFNGKYGMG